MTRFIGVDLAWGGGADGRVPNETGVVVLDEQGQVLEAGWTVGVEATATWLKTEATPDSVIAIDAPLVITNETGMRECEREVARGYGRWQVAANASNTSMGWKAGVALRERLEGLGFTYVDGLDRAGTGRPRFFECYPYTTLVGMPELGYDRERPRYKRLIPGLNPEGARTERARQCDELIQRMLTLEAADPPLALASHRNTRILVEEPSPAQQSAYKHREDLLDAAICAWTASIWSRWGEERVQVLGAGAEVDDQGRRPTIVAPARREQRIAGTAARPPRSPSPIEQPRAASAPSAVDVLDAALGVVRNTTRFDEAVAARIDALRLELARLPIAPSRGDAND